MKPKRPKYKSATQSSLDQLRYDPQSEHFSGSLTYCIDKLAARSAAHDFKCELGSLKMDRLGRINILDTWSSPSRIALSQLLTRISPSADVNYMLDLPPEIRAVNYNWFINRLDSRAMKRKILVRTLVEPYTDNLNMRAALGEHYNVIDDEPLVRLISTELPVMREEEIFGGSESCTMSIGRYTRSTIVIPMSDYTSKISSLYSINVGKWIAVVNSEVGQASLLIAPAVKMMGILVVDDVSSSIRIPHVGKASVKLKNQIDNINKAYTDIIQQIRRVSTLKIKWRSNAMKILAKYGLPMAESYTNGVLRRIGLSSWPSPAVGTLPRDVYISELLENRNYDPRGHTRALLASSEESYLKLTQEKVDKVVENEYNDVMSSAVE